MKTIQKIIIALALLAITISLSAQVKDKNPYEFEFHAGGNLSKMSITGGNADDKLKVGFHFTGLLIYNFNNSFSLQTGLSLSKKGMKQDLNSYEEDELTGKITHLDVETTVDANYIQLPLMVGVQLPISDIVSITLHGGGYGGYGFTGETKMKGTEQTLYGSIVGSTRDIDSKEDTFDNTLKKFDYGLTGSVGLLFDDMYTVRFNYEHGLADLSNTSVYKSMKNRNFTLSVGFRF